MGTAIYIVTQKEIDGFDPFVNGKAIGRLDSELLERMCAAADVPSLLEFISQDPDELAEFLDDEDAAKFPGEEWFSAQQGLQLVNGLLSYLKQNPAVLPNSVSVIEDLNEYAVVLNKLAESGVAWHFAVDI